MPHLSDLDVGLSEAPTISLPLGSFCCLVRLRVICRAPVLKVDNYAILRTIGELWPFLESLHLTCEVGASDSLRLSSLALYSRAEMGPGRGRFDTVQNQGVPDHLEYFCLQIRSMTERALLWVACMPRLRFLSLTVTSLPNQDIPQDAFPWLKRLNITGNFSQLMRIWNTSIVSCLTRTKIYLWEFQSPLVTFKSFFSLMAQNRPCIGDLKFIFSAFLKVSTLNELQGYRFILSVLKHS